MKRRLALGLSWMLLILVFATSGSSAEAEGLSAYTTVLDATDWALCENIDLAIEALNGTRVASGAVFSFNKSVGPRTAERGYQKAVNGRGVQVVGGGVSQVASTLYLALKERGGYSIRDKKTYGDQFTGGYVDAASDAVVTDYANGIDFSFQNDGSDMIISFWRTDETVCCTLTADDSDGWVDNGQDWGDDGQDWVDDDQDWADDTYLPDDSTSDGRACGAYVRATAEVNIRSGPSLYAEVLKTAYLGDTYTYLGRTVYDDRGVAWYKIAYSRGSGYISSRYSKLIGEPVYTGYVRTTAEVNLRSGPGLYYEELTSVSRGRTFDYLGRTTYDNRGVAWYKIAYGYGSAYISSRYAVLYN